MSVVLPEAGMPHTRRRHSGRGTTAAAPASGELAMKFLPAGLPPLWAGPELGTLSLPVPRGLVGRGRRVGHQLRTGIEMAELSGSESIQITRLSSYSERESGEDSDAVVKKKKKRAKRLSSSSFSNSRSFAEKRYVVYCRTACKQACRQIN